MWWDNPTLLWVSVNCEWEAVGPLPQSSVMIDDEESLSSAGTDITLEFIFHRTLSHSFIILSVWTRKKGSGIFSILPSLVRPCWSRVSRIQIGATVPAVDSYHIFVDYCLYFFWSQHPFIHQSHPHSCCFPPFLSFHPHFGFFKRSQQIHSHGPFLLRAQLKSCFWSCVYQSWGMCIESVLQKCVKLKGLWRSYTHQTGPATPLGKWNSDTRPCVTMAASPLCRVDRSRMDFEWIHCYGGRVVLMWYQPTRIQRIM